MPPPDTTAAPAPPPDEVAAVARLAEDFQRLRAEIARVVIGQDEVVDQLLTGLFARGHVLLVGVPGLAKTLLVATVARILSLSFRRIQFTPDMMPSDITGTDILQDDPETGRRAFAFVAGPLFANIILADEINRTPPKTQAALLEAMQERHVTAGNRTYPLPDPFFVLATQNPIEQEGTYPLPEAQLDRFMLNVRVPYPTAAEELEILRQTTGDRAPDPQVILSADQILAAQALVRRVPVPDHVFLHARDLVRSSRPDGAEATDLIRRCVAWGAGPRAGQALILAAKARAVLQGRYAATVDDIRHVAPPVLRHRISPTFHAEAEGLDADKIIAHLLGSLPSQSVRH
ncbi:AAA family ATPase [Tundrisphaera sp. TA3]|uniref:AAA family ATPase n=1 Tax=Tundrisphaera sp. TA3 TaxID=3435775 RepID=UPI003EBF981D